MLTDPDANACWGVVICTKECSEIVIFLYYGNTSMWSETGHGSTTLIQEVLYQGLKTDKGAELQGSEVTSG